MYDRVQNRVKGQASAREFLVEVDIQARDYASLFNVSSSKWSTYPRSSKKSLETLSLFNIRPFRPLLLSIVRRFSAEETDRALKALVSLGVRLIIASSTRSGSVEQPLARAARDIFAAEITDSTQLFQSLVGVIPSEDQFREAFLIAQVSNSKFARYYLRCLESACKKEREPWFVPNEDALSITLEHILPRVPEDNWPSFTNDEVKLYSKRIGNLALLQATPNSNLQSKSFSEKKPVYAVSPYETTSMVADHDSWTADEIVDRQRSLAELAVLAWPLPSAF